MTDTTIKKIDSSFSPKGHKGQKYLVSGKSLSMRLWESEKVGEKESTTRDYETVGYVIAGKAELNVAGQIVSLAPGRFVAGTCRCNPFVPNTSSVYGYRGNFAAGGSAWT